MQKRSTRRVRPRVQGVDALDYINAMLRELRIMAKDEGADLLAYLIEMAMVEANDRLQEAIQGRGGAQASGSSDTKPPG